MLIIEKVKNYINNLSLKRKIIVIAFVGISTVALFSTIAFYIIILSNNKIIRNSIASSLSYSSNEIDNLLDSVDTTSDLVIADATVQSRLSSILDSGGIVSAGTTEPIYSRLNTYLFANDYISYISIYHNNIRTSTTGYHPTELPVETKNMLEEEALALNGKIAWVSSEASDTGVFLTRNIREIKHTSLANLGILVIRLDMDKILESSTQFITQFQNVNFVLLDGDEVIYSTMDFDTSYAKELVSINNSYDIIKIEENRYFAVNGYISRTNWNFICLAPYEEVFNTITATYVTCVFIVIFSVFLAVYISDTLVKNITKHFDILIKKMTTFTGSNKEKVVTTYDYTNREDELGILHKHFDRMVEEIQTLINDNYIKQILIKDASLKALETQINPHFLYNILESVNWRAKAIGEEQISLMVESLGALLRATLSQDFDVITLEKEIEFVQNYINIQQIRFEDRLCFHLNLEPLTLQAPISKLSVQPLVENAIHYSLEINTEDCNIYISSELSEEVVKIYVKNDGSEFADNLLDKLKTKEISPHGLGIGLVNIDARLKLTFGEEYGLTLYNEDNMAVAMISIPFHLSSKENPH